MSAAARGCRWHGGGVDGLLSNEETLPNQPRDPRPVLQRGGYSLSNLWGPFVF